MHTTDERLWAAAQLGAEKYYPAVIEETRQLHERLTSPHKLTSTVVGSDVSRIKELLSAALVLNDCTAIVFNAVGGLKVSLPQPDQYRKMFGSEQLRFVVSREQIRQHSLNEENLMMSPCFIYSDSIAQRPLMNALLPLIKDGRVFFQPSRGILTRRDVPNDWHVIGVDSDQPLDLWEPSVAATDSKPVRVEVQGAGAHGETLFEVTIPFLKGVPLGELGKMLKDEEDLVVAFRSSIRTAVREAMRSGLQVAEVVNDVVQPKVSALDRKLRTLQRIHRIKIGGAAMSSVALAFTAASTGSIGGGLLAVASAGGFGFVANQYTDYLAKRDELHQDPYFFLWKVRRGVKK